MKKYKNDSNLNTEKDNSEMSSSDKKGLVRREFLSKFKLVYAIVQIILFYTVVCLFPGYDLLAVLGLVIIYLVPLYINSYHIKFVRRAEKLSSYYIDDLIYYYLPSVGASLVLEIILYFTGAIESLLGFFTVVIFITFTIITLIQWLRYFVQFRMIKLQTQINSKKDI